jgi:hypothetical protein
MLLRSPVSAGNFSGILGISNGGTGAGETKQILQEKIVFLATQVVISAGATKIPLDNTLPQSNEGTAISGLDLSIAPKSANSWLHIKGRLHVSSVIAGDHAMMAIFQDAETDAKIGFRVALANADHLYYIDFETWVYSSNLNTRTFKIRASGLLGGMYVNGNSVNLYNLGSVQSWMFIEEMAYATSSSVL